MHGARAVAPPASAESESSPPSNRPFSALSICRSAFVAASPLRALPLRCCFPFLPFSSPLSSGSGSDDVGVIANADVDVDLDVVDVDMNVDVDSVGLVAGSGSGSGVCRLD